MRWYREVVKNQVLTKNAHRPTNCAAKKKDRKLEGIESTHYSAFAYNLVHVFAKQ